MDGGMEKRRWKATEGDRESRRVEETEELRCDTLEPSAELEKISPERSV